MNDSKYDRLAGRLDERLETSPRRGVAVGGDQRRVLPPPAVIGSLPARRRGHLVPAELHRAARRHKALGTDRSKATWSDVLVVGVGELLDRRDLDDLIASLPATDGPKRLVQATLPTDLDRRLTERHLDLNDAGTPTTYEQLWAIAIRLWLDQHDSENRTLR